MYLARQQCLGGVSPVRTINLAAINLSIQFFRTLRTSRDRLTANAHRAAAGGHHVERKTRMICDNIYVV